jgi:hypothetical protein
MTKKIRLDIPDHEFAMVVFVDPAYSSGWTDRQDTVRINDIIHVGCGVVVSETKTTITLALMVGLFDKEKNQDVLNPFTLHKEKGILWLHRFAWTDWNTIKKSKRVRRDIDSSIEHFLAETIEPAGTLDGKEVGGKPKPLHEPS